MADAQKSTFVRCSSSSPSYKTQQYRVGRHCCVVYDTANISEKVSDKLNGQSNFVYIARLLGTAILQDVC
jgi:hypothetical protein